MRPAGQKTSQGHEGLSHERIQTWHLRRAARYERGKSKSSLQHYGS